MFWIKLNTSKHGKMRNHKKIHNNMNLIEEFYLLFFLYIEVQTKSNAKSQTQSDFYISEYYFLNNWFKENEIF